MKLIIIFLLFIPQIALALSMRDCAILPITDTAGDALGSKIFDRVEKHLKEKMWCRYKPSSDVIGILSKYRDNLDKYLENEIVLKTIIKKLNVGSLIRIKLDYSIDQVEVEMRVIGQTGTDYLFSEKELLERIDEDQIFKKLEYWLETYENSIPYDGKIIGVLGDQITFSIHKQEALSEGQEFEVRRATGKKKHPLLKKIVEWNSILLAKGKIYKLSDRQILGLVKTYTNDSKLMSGDWIVIKSNDSIIPPRFGGRLVKKYEQGKLGELEIGLNVGSTTVSTSPSSGNKKYSGYTYGVDIDVEAWVTRNFYAYGKFDRYLGDLELSSGDATSDETGINSGVIKLAAGYKYLPLGFFYGPQVNFYAGWVSYNYQVDSSSVDGLGSATMSGVLTGGYGSVPLQRGIRAFARGEIIPIGEVSDDDNIFGKNKKLTSFLFHLGLRYQYNPFVTLVGKFESLNNTAKFKGSKSELAFRNNSIKVTALFNF